MKPVEKKSLYLKISDSIYNYIRVNDLRPGDKLPSERDMSEMLETSRNSVREALRILEDRGLIYVKTGSGVFIKDTYGSGGTLAFQLKGCSLKEIQELQMALDRQAVLNAAARASQEEKQELCTIASEMVRLAKENIYSHTLDHSFHEKLYACGKNNAIEQMIIRIRQNRFIIRSEQEQENESVWLPTVPEHLDLARALLENEREKAIHAIEVINEYGFQLTNEEPMPE